MFNVLKIKTLRNYLQNYKLKIIKFTSPLSLSHLLGKFLLSRFNFQ